MRNIRLSILLLSLSIVLALGAQDSVPNSASQRFPNIQASLDDGFYALAEQQARGILREGPNDAEERDALLLLAHALWGQKRYSEMIAMLNGVDDDPGYVYWRARAFFELHQYEEVLSVLDADKEVLSESHYEPVSLRLRGRVQQLLGRFAEAESAYEAFAKTYPDHADALDNQFDLADVYIMQKRIPEAMAIYETLSKSGDRNAVQRARLRLAHVLYTEGAEENFRRARFLLSTLTEDEEARLAYRIDACIDLAALEEKSGNSEKAAEALKTGIALSPDANQRVPLKLALARMLLRDDDTSGALKLLEECRTEAPNESIAAELQLEKAGALLQAKRYADAEEAYQVYLDVASDPSGIAKAYMGKGQALWGLERFSESASMYDKAEKVFFDPEGKAVALFKAGDAYYQAGLLDDAEKRYLAFVVNYSQRDDIPNALYQLGLVLAKIGRRSEALTTFGIIESSHAYSPFSEKAALRTADVMLASGQWEEALEKFTQIGQVYTNMIDVALSQHQRGLVLYQLGRYPDAQQVFESVITNFPDSSVVPQASYMRGFSLYQQGQVDEAVETSKGFIEKYPDSEWTPDVIFWLAERYYNQGKYEEAEPLFLRITNDFAGHRLAARALYWAGRAAADKSNYVKAIERYSEVAKTYPDSEILPQTRFAQGDALTELGEFARAILAFEEILKNYPESHLVSAAWGRKADCQYSLAMDNPVRYEEAINSYQAVLNRPSSSPVLKMQAEYKIGRCLEKTGFFEQAFSRYMNVVYTFINVKVERTPYSIMWFTRAAFGAASLKEREHVWVEAVKIYGRVINAGVPARDEAQKRIERIKTENWLLFQQSEEMDNVGIDD
jgi:TolA-binding protein